MRQGEWMANRYELIKQIGKGGGGIVYLAEDYNLQKQVVIKEIMNCYIQTKTLRTEVDILKRLHHAALPQVYDYLEIEGRVFTVMEYIKGNNLQEYLDAGYQFSQEQILIWARQLADVVAYMHNQPYPVIHRDIKPSNIMIKPDGNLCLIDFNISDDVLQTDKMDGFSIGYASPEQQEKGRRILSRLSTEGIVVDKRTDIYSMGAVFYRLLAGSEKSPGSPGLKDMNCCWMPLAVITDKCMEENPARRYQSADDLLFALNHLEKTDNEYKKWNRLILLNRLCWIFITVLGGTLFFYGKSVNTKEAYLKDYEAYMESVEQHSDEAEKKGLAILNDRNYRTILKNNPDEKADIFYYLALSYMDQELYQKAIGYFEEALDIDEDQPIYYRDYARALLGDGQIGAAKNVLSQAKIHGISEVEMDLLEGEIAYQEGRYENAKTIFQNIIEQGSDLEGKNRARSSYAKTCLKLSQYEEVISTLKEKYGEKAISEYSLEDCLNLALAYQCTGEYSISEEILLEEKKVYPKEYRIYMRLSYLAYEEESRKASGLRNYKAAWDYYQAAEQVYKKEGTEKENDSEWMNLCSIMNQLKEYGWL